MAAGLWLISNGRADPLLGFCGKPRAFRGDKERIEHGMRIEAQCRSLLGNQGIKALVVFM
jgi:hypothetical protein